MTNPKMNRKQRTAEIPAWICLARPYKLNGELCQTKNEAQTRYCPTCSAAWHASSEYGSSGGSSRSTTLEVDYDIRRSVERYLEAKERIEALHDDAMLIEIETGYAPTGSKHGNGSDFTQDSAEATTNHHKSTFWRRVAEHAQIREVMTNRRWTEFSEQLENPKQLPEVSERAVLSTLRGWRSSMPEFLQESIAEVFEWLTPPAFDGEKWNPGYKSHDGIAIGKRIIKEYMVSTWGGSSFHMRDEAQQRIQCLDNVFHLYDGKGFATEAKETALVPVLRAGLLDASQREVKTAYFRVKWFRNGNMHIFPDQKLAAAINRDQLAGKLPAVKFAA